MWSTIACRAIGRSGPSYSILYVLKSLALTPLSNITSSSLYDLCLVSGTLYQHQAIHISDSPPNAQVN